MDLKRSAVEFFEAGPGDLGVEVNSFKEGIDLNAGLSDGGEGPLCPLAGRPQSS